MAGYKYRQHGISPAIQPYREYNTDLWEVVPKITLYKKTISHLLRQVAYLSHRAAKLEAENARLRDQMADVESFINQRPEYINALRNCTGDADGDYSRWSGHAEGRRQLAQRLGYTVPYEFGERAEREAS